MTDDLTTRLLAAIEEVELAIGNLSPNLLLAHCAAHRKILDLHRPYHGICFECRDSDGDALPAPCDTICALAAAYDLTTEPAP